MIQFVFFSIFTSPLLAASFSASADADFLASNRSSSSSITGKTNEELFNHYRCKLCQDLIVDNVEFADGELVINEKLVIKFCQTFFSKTLHNSFGGVVCNTVVKAKLDQVIKNLQSNESAVKVGDQVCRAVQFCE